MSAGSEQRKLAAIMFTDMVGYSALSQRDDKLAQELLEEHRQLLREIFPRFNGTEIKTIGDAFLVEFQSALEAAQCAMEIQRALAKRNADAPAERQIQVRIGVHIGDVVHRGGDVYGDGVNIASRIESLAAAGGICVSMDVERQIRNTLEARFEKLAPTELKNISVPMDLFRIVLPWERDAGLKPERQKPDIGQRRAIPLAWIGAVVLLLGVIGGGIFVFQRVRSSARSHLEGGAPATPPAQGLAGARPSIPEKSIAVLPLENLSDEKENAFFAEGIQDELLSNLSKIKDLKVISRTSFMQYKTAITRNLREIARQLGVSNVVEGSVRRSGNHIRVSIQLIDALTDRHICVQNYDRTLADSLALQGELATEIAAGVGATLSPQEKARVEAKPTNNPAAYDAYLRGRAVEAGSVFDKSNVERAIESYQEAVKLDSNFALAWAYLSCTQSQSYWQGHDPSPAQLAAAKDAADRALALDPNLPETHLALGYYRYFGQQDFTAGLAEFQQAEKGLPNNVDVIFAIALI